MVLTNLESRSNLFILNEIDYEQNYQKVVGLLITIIDINTFGFDRDVVENKTDFKLLGAFMQFAIRFFFLSQHDKIQKLIVQLKK